MVQQIFPLFFLKHFYWYPGSLTQISQTVLDQTHSYYVEFDSMWTFKLYNTQSCTSKIDICIAAQFSHLHMCQDLMLPFIGILHKCVFFDTEHTLPGNPLNAPFLFLSTAFPMLIMFFHCKSYFDTGDNWLDLDHCLFMHGSLCHRKNPSLSNIHKTRPPFASTIT